MRETPREVLIWQIVKDDLPDNIGITAEEYEYAGWQYQTGMFVFGKNLALAKKCYTRSAEMGNYKAMMPLAEICYGEQDMEGYYHWILEAALSGDVPKAYLKLGEMYFEGTYVSNDYRKAYRYFELAAEAKAEGAYYYLGLYLDHGLLERGDRDEAVRYYLLGAKQYDERCWSRLKELNIDF